MNTLSNFSTICHLFGAFVLAAAMSLVADEAMAKVALTKITTTATGSGAKRDGKGPQKRETTHLLCMGLPTYITADNQNKTQVYVYDGDNPSQFNKENISQIATENYRVEADEDWSQITIFFGGDVYATVPKNPIMVMDDGNIGDLLLGGFDQEDLGHFSPDLTIQGGQVKYISVVGGQESPLNGATIYLENMTYTGSIRMNLARSVSYSSAGDGSISEPTYDTSNVNFSYDPNSCTFLVPETNPNFDPETQPHAHSYKINELVPDPIIVNAGVVTVGCKNCSQTWTLNFGLIGNSGPDWNPQSNNEQTGFSYCVTEDKTIEAPTCQPGKAQYTLHLYFHGRTNSHHLIQSFESKIPPVEDIHDWGADGICHHKHYQMQKDENDNVLKDEFDNILYVCDANGNAIEDNTVYTMPKNYIRKDVTKYYYDENGVEIRHEIFKAVKLSYLTWESEWHDDLKEMMINIADGVSTEKQVIAGFAKDYDFSEGVTETDRYIFLNFKSYTNGITFNLHGHTISATKSDGYYAFSFNGASTTKRPQNLTLRNGNILADLINSKELLLDNITQYTGTINASSSVTLRNNTSVYVDPLKSEISCNKIITDETSMWCTLFADDQSYMLTDAKNVQNLLYTRSVSESLAGKWQALMVPFSIEMTQEVLDACDIAELYMISTKGSSAGGTSEGGHDQPNVAVLMKYELGDYTPASTPLFIRPKQAGTLSILQSTAEIEPSDNIQLVSCATTKDSYELHGVYDGSFTTPENDNYYYTPLDGELKRFSGRLSHANRWYLQKQSKSQQANQAPLQSLLMQTYGEDDISDLNVIEAVMPAQSGIYTIDGRKVAKKLHLTSGFYIKDNKKIIVR